MRARWGRSAPSTSTALVAPGDAVLPPSRSLRGRDGEGGRLRSADPSSRTVVRATSTPSPTQFVGEGASLGERVRANPGARYSAGFRIRSSPSCTVLATSVPSRVKMDPRVKPRAPAAAGASMA